MLYEAHLDIDGALDFLPCELISTTRRSSDARGPEDADRSRAHRRTGGQSARAAGHFTNLAGWRRTPFA